MLGRERGAVTDLETCNVSGLGCLPLLDLFFLLAPLLPSSERESAGGTSFYYPAFFIFLGFGHLLLRSWFGK